jgi:hypothetical protein
MTRDEFYEKWKGGSSDETIGFNKNEMIQDLDLVIHAAVSSWNYFTDSQCRSIVDLDKFIEKETQKIRQSQ